MGRKGRGLKGTRVSLLEVWFCGARALDEVPGFGIVLLPTDVSPSYHHSLLTDGNRWWT